MADLATPPSSISRVVYMGSPGIAVPPLEGLVQAGFEVPLVITRPDARRGRGGKTTPNPVKVAAEELGIPVSHDLADVTSVEADIGVVVAYGRIIPTEVLQQIALVNLHFSLLPKWRGAAPLERALIAGDSETGVCLMAIAEGLDTGGVYDVETIEIQETWGLSELGAKCVDVGTSMLVRNLTDGLRQPAEQIGDPTYASMLSAAEFEITTESTAAGIVRHLKVRPCWMMVDGKRVKVIAASVASAHHDVELGELKGVALGLADGALQLVTVQPEGKKPMPASDWAQGRQGKSSYLDLVT